MATVNGDCFKEKTFLITGAGKGIGRALVKRLHSYQAVIVAVSRTQADLDSLTTECPGIKCICVDFSDWDATRTALKDLGPIQYLVNNAAILKAGNFMDITKSDFNEVMSINLLAYINVGQIVAEKMISNKVQGGSIVNMSSLGGSSPFPPLSLYGLSKAGVDMLTKIMAVELGRKGIRVNSVSPTGVDTKMYGQFYSGSASVLGIPEEHLRQGMALRSPLGTVDLEMEHLINAVLFILSPATPLINGESLVIDAGVRHA